MTKTFTCREIGGVCEEKFSGNTLMEVVQKAARHMMSDNAHKEQIMSMAQRTGENREQWMERMLKEFEARR